MRWGKLGYISWFEFEQIENSCTKLMIIKSFIYRWLWINGRKDEALKIIGKALKMNGSSITLDNFDSKQEKPLLIKPIGETNDDEGAGITDLFRTPNLRRNTLNIMFAWFANSIVYYGLSFSTGNMKGNPYFILFVMGLVELPTYILTIYLMDKWGRRSLTVYNMLIGGICCIVAALAGGNMVSTLFVFTGKFLIASSFSTLCNYSAELFPTVIRNSALGLGSMCARLAGAITPLLLLLDSLDPRMPSIIFAIISVVSGIWVMFLPETVDRPMPQTISDGERFGVGDTMFASMCGKANEEVEMETKARSNY